METDVLLTCCALRTRVSISAMGSLMLMVLFLLPAGLGHAGDFAAHGHFAQFVARQAEFAEDATGTAGHDAAVALARRAGIARQLLQLQTGLVAVLVGPALIVDDRLEGGALGSEFLDLLGARRIAVDEGYCGGFRRLL